MRTLCFCLFLVVAPLQAQQRPADAPGNDAGNDARDDAGEVGRGLDLLSEGMRLLLEGLQDEMAPALEGLRDMLQNLDVYYPPEMLPNGDIIIRRKTPLDTLPGPDEDLDV